MVTHTIAKLTTVKEKGKERRGRMSNGLMEGWAVIGK